MTDTTRRDFLKMTGMTLGACAAAPLWLRLGPAGAEGGGGGGARRKLVVVLLEGGNDGLNTVIPYGNPTYYARRPTIAYRADDVLALPGADGLGLNPSLAQMARLYGEGKVALIQGVGYDEPDLSHFASMDVWQSASPSHAFTSGWLGRYLDRSPGGGVVRAVAVGNRLPMAIVGEGESGVAVPSLHGFTFADGPDTDPASEPYRLHEAFLQAAATATFEGTAARALVDAQRRTVDAVRAVSRMAATDKEPAPTATLADRMSIAMRLLASDLGAEIAFLTLGSFDHHAATSINHPALLAHLDAATLRFSEEAARLGAPGDYLLMTFSEFGRRLAEDGSAGTDHGTAAPMFVVGDAVAGGLHGAHPSLEAADLDAHGNLRRSVDFREVYATIVDRWFAGPSSAEVLRLTGREGLHPVPFLR
jgi:uncharacterized protein (DUF1501 family)